MSRRPLPFLGSFFKPSPSSALSPLNITAMTETVPETGPEVSAESASILRRGNWDYMTVRVKDKAAQQHPDFVADLEYDEDCQVR